MLHVSSMALGSSAASPARGHLIGPSLQQGAQAWLSAATPRRGYWVLLEAGEPEPAGVWPKGQEGPVPASRQAVTAVALKNTHRTGTVKRQAKASDFKKLHSNWVLRTEPAGLAALSSQAFGLSDKHSRIFTTFQICWHTRRLRKHCRGQGCKQHAPLPTPAEAKNAERETGRKRSNLTLNRSGARH